MLRSKHSRKNRQKLKLPKKKKQPKRKPIEVKKHSSCSEGMWITASRTGAQYLNGVAQGCRRRSSEVCARDVRVQEERRA